MAAHFFDDPDFDFTACTSLGHAALGTSDIGPILEALARIENGDGTRCSATARRPPAGCPCTSGDRPRPASVPAAAPSWVDGLWRSR